MDSVDDANEYIHTHSLPYAGTNHYKDTDIYPAS
jgi:hypothetical protein